MDLRCFVPPVVATRLGSEPTQKAWADTLLAAVLFADISGFTALAERLAGEGPDGAERLSRKLDSYFGKLFDLIERYGGEVLKIAGDAPIVLFPAREDGLKMAVQRAADCALQMTALQEEGLKLRAGLGAGEIFLAGVGGLLDRWEFLAAGDPMQQVSQAEAKAQLGEVVVSAQAWQYLQDLSQGEAREDCTRLLEIAPTETVSALEVAPSPYWRDYVPGAALFKIEAGLSDWMAELREVSIIFCKIIGLEYPRPDYLAELQAAALVLQRGLYRFEGSLNQLLVDDKGTVMVAAFGLPPVAHDDDPARAIEAALDILQGLRELGLDAALGISTGRVFCGVRGGRQRREYCLIGDRVNLSARLMQAAYKEQVGLLCDQETANRSRHRCQLEPRPPMKVKGKEEELTVFRPLSLASTASTMVGRESELESLQKSEGPTLMVGEAGSGKTLLLRELEKTRTTLLRLQADPLFSKVPFGLFRELLQEHHLRLQNHPFAALVHSPQAYPELSSVAKRQVFMELHLLLLQSLAQDGATLVIEDGHWLDESSKSLLERVRGPFNMVVTSRLSLKELRHFVLLELKPLSLDDTETLIKGRLGSQLDSGLAQIVWDTTRGNPFFALELLAALSEAGVLNKDGSIQGSPDWKALSSVTGAITSRLDRLTPSQSLALKVASVVGFNFALPVLCAVHPVREEKTRLAQTADELVERDLTSRLDRQEYQFCHVLTQEVAYDMMLYAQRRQLHQAVAEHLQSQLRHDSPLIAHHWLQAKRPELALPHLIETGEQALLRGGYHEAEQWLTQALSLCPEPLKRPRLQRQLCEAHYGQGHLEHCRHHLMTALKAWGFRVPSSASELWREPSHWFFTFLRRLQRIPGPWSPAALRFLDLCAVLAVGPRTRAILKRSQACSGERMEQVLAWEKLTMLWALEGELELSLQAGGPLMELAEELGPSPALARAYGMAAAGCVTVLSLPRLANFYAATATVLARRFPDPALEARIHYCLATLPIYRAEWSQGERLLGLAAQAFDSVLDSRQAAECRVLQVEIMIERGEIAKALELAQSILSEGRLDLQEKAWTHTFRGLALTWLGCYDQAFQALKEAEIALTRLDDIIRANWLGIWNAWCLLSGSSQFRPLPSVEHLPSIHWVRTGVFWGAWAGAQRGEDAHWVSYLTRSAKYFPNCRAAAALCQGVQKSSQSWIQKALELAKRDGLPLLETLALKELGSSPGPS